MQKVLDRTVTAYLKGTACVRAEEGITYSQHHGFKATIRRCHRSAIQCRIHDFFVDNRGKFERIADAIRSESAPSRQLAQTAKVIDRASKDPTHLCDDRVCKQVGDTIAAIDGSGMDHFAANNPEEWTLLARVLGKPLINPVVVGKEHRE